MDSLPLSLLVNTAGDKMLDQLLNKLLAGHSGRVFPNPHILPFPGPKSPRKGHKDTVSCSGHGNGPRPAA